MNSLDITQQRLSNQHLAGNPLNKPEDVVAWLGAVQAQDYAGAKWAVGQRVLGADDATLDTYCGLDRFFLFSTFTGQYSPSNPVAAAASFGGYFTDRQRLHPAGL